MIKIVNKVPLLNDPKNVYTGAEFNLKKYQILQPATSQIKEYNIKTNQTNNIKVSNPYSSITKDDLNQLFYMASSSSVNKLYRTTENYEEIDSLELKVPKEYIAKINAISLNNYVKKILITTDKNVYSVNFAGNFITTEISDNTVTTLLGTTNQTTRIINQCGCFVKIPVLSNDLNFFTSGAYFCDKKYIAYIKNGSAYIANISPNGNIIDINYIGDDIVINSIFSVNGTMNLLVTKNKKYNYIYITDLICCKNLISDCDREKCHVYDCQKYPVDNCDNKEYVEIKEKQNMEYIEMIDNHEKCSSDSYYSIIESIALVETAISHILNAEGEKIQKVISMANDTCELLEVNNSVNQIIKNVTYLEHILYDKLELAKNKEDCCDDLKEDFI
ncbi:MAG: hypothetical protein RR847_04475 [Bacilli bacterium]